MLSEADGCELLHTVFRARGYRTQADVLFAEDGLEFHADGWDPDARVGFEYLTSESDDHHDLSAHEVTRLGDRMDRGELFILIIDESEVADAATLRFAAERFLDAVARRRAGAT